MKGLKKTTILFIMSQIFFLHGMKESDKKAQLRREQSCPLPKSNSIHHNWRKSLQQEIAGKAILEAQTDSPRTQQKNAAKKAEEVYPTSYNFDERATEGSFRPFQNL